jgi:hypothetical protein
MKWHSVIKRVRTDPQTESVSAETRTRRNHVIQTIFQECPKDSTAIELRYMRIIFLLVVFSAATPCVAADDSIPLRPMPQFHRSEKTCLSVYYNGAAAYWLNQCEYSIAVRWDDEATCKNWSCLAEVPASARSTAAISRHVRWCECPGTLSTCNIPATGCQ